MEVCPSEGKLLERSAADFDLLLLYFDGTEMFVEGGCGVLRQDPEKHSGEAAFTQGSRHGVEEESARALVLLRLQEVDGVEFGVVGFDWLSEGAAADEADDAGCGFGDEDDEAADG